MKLLHARERSRELLETCAFLSQLGFALGAYSHVLIDDRLLLAGKRGIVRQDVVAVGEFLAFGV